MPSRSLPVLSPLTIDFQRCLLWTDLLFPAAASDPRSARLSARCWLPLCSSGSFSLRLLGSPEAWWQAGPPGSLAGWDFLVILLLMSHLKLRCFRPVVASRSRVGGVLVVLLLCSPRWSLTRRFATALAIRISVRGGHPTSCSA